MNKIYSEENRIGTYSCDRNKVAKLSGILQATQEAGRKQMALQKPSYDDLQAEGKALMLSRLDLKIYDTLYFEHASYVAQRIRYRQRRRADHRSFYSVGAGGYGDEKSLEGR